MSTEENKALVRRLIETGSKGREAWFAARPQLFSDDEVVQFAGMPPLDRRAHEQFDEAMFGAFPDAQFIVDDLVAEGDKVVARLTFSGTHRGEFQGIPPTGKSFAITGIAIYRIASGKVAEEWGILDQMSMLQQLGVIPPMG